MSISQIQIKVSLSQQLNNLLTSKAQRLGVPVTQLVKHIIIKEVETEQYPKFIASSRVADKAKRALQKINKSDVVNNVDEYFNNL